MNKSKQGKVHYASLEEKPVKPSVRYTAMGLAILFLILGIYTKSFYGIAVGIILAAAMCFERKLCMTEQGLEIDYKLIVPLYSEIWSYDQIDSIHWERWKDPSAVVLNIMKGLQAKRLLFSAETAEEVVQLALEKNKNIYYDETKKI